MKTANHYYSRISGLSMLIVTMQQFASNQSKEYNVHFHAYIWYTTEALATIFIIDFSYLVSNNLVEQSIQLLLVQHQIR